MLRYTIHWSQNITGTIIDYNNPLEFAAVAITNPINSTFIT